MNKMRDSRGVSSKPLGTPLTKNSGTGVKGTNPSPTFSPYKQSMGKDTIPTKFGETGLGTAMKKTNKVRSASNQPGGTAKEATSSTVKRGPNRIRSARTTKPMGSI